MSRRKAKTATHATPDPAPTTLVVAAPADDTRPWQDKFIDALRESSVVAYAALAAGVNRSTAYRERETDPAFAERWTDAIEDAMDYLEYKTRLAALAGNYQLQMFLLKAYRPERFRDTVRQELTGKDGKDLFPPKPLEAMTDDELAAYIATLAESSARASAAGAGAAR